MVRFSNAELLTFASLELAQAALAGKESLRSAVTYANQALAKDPRSPTAMRALVDVHHLSGRSIEALVLARAALEAMAYSTVEVAQAMEADSRVEMRELRVDGGFTAW